MARNRPRLLCKCRKCSVITNLEPYNYSRTHNTGAHVLWLVRGGGGELMVKWWELGRYTFPRSRCLHTATASPSNWSVDITNNSMKAAVCTCPSFLYYSSAASAQTSRRESSSIYIYRFFFNACPSHFVLNILWTFYGYVICNKLKRW